MCLVCSLNKRLVERLVDLGQSHSYSCPSVFLSCVVDILAIGEQIDRARGIVAVCGTCPLPATGFLL